MTVSKYRPLSSVKTGPQIKLTSELHKLLFLPVASLVCASQVNAYEEHIERIQLYKSFHGFLKSPEAFVANPLSISMLLFILVHSFRNPILNPPSPNLTYLLLQ